MNKMPSDDNLQKVLAIDEDFRAFIADNEEASWRLYCKKNGLDPTATGDNDAITPEDFTS